MHNLHSEMASASSHGVSHGPGHLLFKDKLYAGYHFPGQCACIGCSVMAAKLMIVPLDHSVTDGPGLTSCPGQRGQPPDGGPPSSLAVVPRRTAASASAGRPRARTSPTGSSLP